MHCGAVNPFDQTPTKVPGKYVALNAARAGKGNGKLVELSPGGTRGKINWREEAVPSLSLQPTRLNSFYVKPLLSSMPVVPPTAPDQRVMVVDGVAAERRRVGVTVKPVGEK